MTDQLLFARRDGGEWVETGAGTRRRVHLHTDDLMMVEFGFEKGAIGPLHSHPHVQVSYVAEGRFKVTVAGRSGVLSAGDSFIVPSNEIHGVEALEAGRLIDSFTPHRADFLKP